MSSIRIYGNRLLKTLPGNETRPTSAMVRQAVFNIWQGSIIDCRWLDLCAGTGAMGAEALCRGAKMVVGVEKSPRACKIIRENWRKIVNPEQEFYIHALDVVTAVKTLGHRQFDRLYFDPPYQSNLYIPVLQAIVTTSILSTDGEIAVEHNPKFWNAIDFPPLTICRQKIYGNTALTFYSLEECNGLANT